MEEEECDGCNGTDPRRRLDDSLLRLVDGILLSLMVATSMPAIDIGTLFIGQEREDREGDDGSGIATRMTTTLMRKRGGTCTISWRSSSADFGKGLLGGGGRQ